LVKSEDGFFHERKRQGTFGEWKGKRGGKNKKKNGVMLFVTEVDGACKIEKPYSNKKKVGRDPWGAV